MLVVVVVLAAAAGGGGTAALLAPGDDPAPAAAPQARRTLPSLPAPSPVLEPDRAERPPPTPQGLAAALGPVLSDPRLGAGVAVQVVDVASGDTLWSRDPARPAVPASTAKLTTAVAALEVLEPDHRFRTRAVAGARPGDVVLVGGGDPTLTAAAAGRPGPYPGAAHLADLAAAVTRSGTRPTRVVVDSSLFTGPAVHPTWDPTDVANGFVAPITALMVDAGRQAPGVRARSPQPQLDAGRKFAAMLGLPPTAVTTGTAPPGARELGAVDSPSLRSLVEIMLSNSDNVLAEALARQVAIAEGQPATFSGAATAVHAVLDSLGVDTSTDHLLDASGLSPGDRLSAGLLTDVLRTAASPAHPGLHALFSGLPVAGYDGTLANRYRSGPTATSAGMVRAKTGTLSRVSALAGVVEDAEGRLLAFAFMADRLAPGGVTAAEAALDTLATTLARCGC